MDAELLTLLDDWDQFDLKTKKNGNERDYEELIYIAKQVKKRTNNMSEEEFSELSEADRCRIGEIINFLEVEID